jgi:hypothetical protein
MSPIDYTSMTHIEGDSMKIFDFAMNAIQYISEGVSRIFSPRDDHYPETGVQPFDGEPFSEWVDLKVTTKEK